MSTASILQQSIIVAGQEITPIIGSLQERAEKIAQFDPNLYTDEEEKLLEIYRLAQGSTRLINIQSAIMVGGANEKGFPRLAIANYFLSLARKRVWTQVNRRGAVSFENDPNWPDWNWRCPAGTLPAWKGLGKLRSDRYASTTVPQVPLELRQPSGKGVYVLFEVNEWRPEVRPVDPVLLQYIGGDICAILGTWDLTEKEVEVIRATKQLGL